MAGDFFVQEGAASYDLWISREQPRIHREIEREFPTK
jgi:hypothetical protein